MQKSKMILILLAAFVISSCQSDLNTSDFIHHSAGNAVEANIAIQAVRDWPDKYDDPKLQF